MSLTPYSNPKRKRGMNAIPSAASLTLFEVAQLGSPEGTKACSLGRFDMSSANVKLAPGRCISQEIGRARGFPIERRYAETEINRGYCGLGSRGGCHRRGVLGRRMFGAEPGASPNARDTRLLLTPGYHMPSLRD